MLPPLVLLSAYALTKISKPLAYLVAVLITLQLIYILVRIYTIAPAKFTTFWSEHAMVAAEKAIQDSAQGKKVVLSIQKIDNIEYAYEVYAKVDPNIVISQYGKYPKVFGTVVINDENAK